MQPKNPVVILALICILDLSCNNKKHFIIEDIEAPQNIVIIPDSIHKKQMLFSLVNEMSSVSKLESEYIGFDGHRSLQPNYSAQLARLADTGYILSLVKHSTPIVRIIAVESLVELKYPDLRLVFLKLINDKDTYTFQSGCMAGPIPINIACYSSISTRLTEKEKHKYKSELMRQYKNTGFEYLLRFDY